jgi:hypothetical protein
MIKRATILAATLGCAAMAYGQSNWIYQRNDQLQEGVDYEINQVSERVVIHQNGSGETFWFDAVIEDASHQYLAPGHIDTITADENLGDVTITVVGDGHQYGAEKVDEIVLSRYDLEGHATTRGHITTLRIFGDLGDADPVHTSALIADSADVIDIGGNLVRPAVIATEAAPADLASFNVTGDLLPQATVTIYGDTTEFKVSGDILVAASCCPQIAQIEQIQRNTHGSLRNVPNLCSSAFETRC